MSLDNPGYREAVKRAVLPSCLVPMHEPGAAGPWTKLLYGGSWTPGV